MAKTPKAAPKPKANTTADAAVPIRVQFFGRFQVSVNDLTINNLTSRAKQPWNLLQYLMVHRKKPVSRQQLVEALWPSGTSDQPDKALKNLVYRVRGYFAAKGVSFAQRVVLYQGGNYALNNALDWCFDFEEIEDCFQKAYDETLPLQERIDAARAAIVLYEGDFLQEQVYEDWVLPFNTYYRSRFFHCVRLTLALLAGTGRDEDIEFICNRAILVDPFEEDFHLEYMQALARQGKKSTAVTHYNKMADMFFREMGVAPNDALRTLYAELSSSLQTVVSNLQSITDGLDEKNVNNDAFCCDFEVFRSVYRLEARSAQRAGQAVFVALVTIQNHTGAPLEESPHLPAYMNLLHSLLRLSLRRGDVVSRFSQCQYILMLPTITFENAERVMARVMQQFERGCAGGAATLHVEVRPLESA